MHVRLLHRLNLEVPKNMCKDEANLEERKVLTNTVSRPKAEQLDSVELVGAKLLVFPPS